MGTISLAMLALEAVAAAVLKQRQTARIILVEKVRVMAHNMMNRGARNRAPGGLLAILWAVSLMCCGSARAADESASSFSGRVSFYYVPRWLGGTNYGDQDIYASVLLDWGENTDRFSGSVYWRGVKDIDGVGTSAGDRFQSVYDAYEGGWYSKLFYAYADVRGEGALGLGRFGRQYLYEGQPFHFDGARLDTGKGPWGVRGSLFGGVPVHYFEESREGDWLVGLGLEARPWRGGKVSLLYAHVADAARFAGLPETTQADDLLVASAAGRLGDWGSALVRCTAVDAGTRDFLVRLQGSDERRDLGFSLSYYSQPSTLAEFSTDISPFLLVAGESYPFRRLALAGSKDFAVGGWKLDAEVRWVTRRLSDPADEGEYNRDYDLLRVGVGVKAPEPMKLSAGLGQAWWWSSGDDVQAFDAEARYEPTENLRLGLGTTYSLYRYDVFSLSEQRDVRETFLRMRWRASKRSQFSFRYAAERQSPDLIHRMRVGWSVLF